MAPAGLLVGGVILLAGRAQARPRRGACRRRPPPHGLRRAGRPRGGLARDFGGLASPRRGRRDRRRRSWKRARQAHRRRRAVGRARSGRRGSDLRPHRHAPLSVIRLVGQRRAARRQLDRQALCGLDRRHACAANRAAIGLLGDRDGRRRRVRSVAGEPGLVTPAVAPGTGHVSVLSSEPDEPGKKRQPKSTRPRSTRRPPSPPSLPPAPSGLMRTCSGQRTWARSSSSACRSARSPGPGSFRR